MSSSSGPIPAPEWVEGMVLYEVATRSFTSPNGPESGTFASLRARLPYIRDLGATCIWLTGHSLSDPSHFYNIWTQYACVEPDRLDPLLGDEAAFKTLIDEAHALGLRVILDVITHGIMPQSPIVRAKPHWFKGGSWGMTDFDWSGHHPDLDDWWVDVWAGYVEKFGIDGFRLDVAAYRWDLWQRVRARAAAVGHPIVIVTEHGPSFQGVNDFYQRSSVRLSNQIRGLLADAPMLHDVPAAVRELVAPFNEQYSVQVMLPTGHPISTEAREGAEPI
ncbi:MAG: alpha-amylase family glycosyl hydrolase, partial [Caldilineaceae bacterium]